MLYPYRVSILPLSLISLFLMAYTDYNGKTRIFLSIH